MIKRNLTRIIVVVVVLLTIGTIYQIYQQGERLDSAEARGDAFAASQRTSIKQARALAAQVERLGGDPVVEPKEIAAPAPSPGPRGEQGIPGPIGPRGPQGPEGEVGIRGPVGPEGDTGPRGAEGATGLTGDVGPTGETGAIGPMGDTGPVGETGPQGVAGDTGATGPQGPPGPQGEQGIQGLQGEPGYPFTFIFQFEIFPFGTYRVTCPDTVPDVVTQCTTEQVE